LTASKIDAANNSHARPSEKNIRNKLTKWARRNNHRV
jgi:hypothetical protein